MARKSAVILVEFREEIGKAVALMNRVDGLLDELKSVDLLETLSIEHFEGDGPAAFTSAGRGLRPGQEVADMVMSFTAAQAMLSSLAEVRPALGDVSFETVLNRAKL